MTYDSRPETYAHSLRVGELMSQLIKELIDRSLQHDRSKTQPPEVDTFDEYTPKLKELTYGTPEYYDCLKGMGPALKHHYANNRHHVEYGEASLEWRPVVGFEDCYEVSNFGDVRGIERTVSRSRQGDFLVSSKAMAAHKTPKGYLRMQLCCNKVQRNLMVHRIVAQAFLPNPDNLPEVNHRNGNKEDNCVSNLEWATPSDNQKHAYANGLKTSESTLKYIVHCIELDIITLGTAKMTLALQDRGYAKASSAGVWQAMDTGGTHLGLRFEGTLLAEYRRNRFNHMTLVDLIEMLADWKAATERMADGSLTRSLTIQQERFDISPQLLSILENTACMYGWLDHE